jgi:hypothetical protein
MPSAAAQTSHANVFVGPDNAPTMAGCTWTKPVQFTIIVLGTIWCNHVHNPRTANVQGIRKAMDMVGSLLYSAQCKMIHLAKGPGLSDRDVWVFSTASPRNSSTHKLRSCSCPSAPGGQGGGTLRAVPPPGPGAQLQRPACFPENRAYSRCLHRPPPIRRHLVARLGMSGRLGVVRHMAAGRTRRLVALEDASTYVDRRIPVPVHEAPAATRAAAAVLWPA